MESEYDEFWWNDMDTAPKSGIHITVQDKDGKVHTGVYWACDTSGEEQPPFKGWFLR